MLSILKLKDSVMATVSATSSSIEKKNLTTAAYVDVEKAPFTRFTDMRAKNVPSSGERLQQEAQEFVCILVCDDFKASSGWLQRFKRFKKCPTASSERW